MHVIGKLGRDWKVDWPRNLPAIVHAYNSTRLPITRYSLHYLMYGHWLHLSINFYFPNIRGMRKHQCVDHYIHKEELNCIQNLTNLEYISDHCIIEWTMRKTPLISEKIEKQSRNLKNINTELFKNDLKNKLENLQKCQYRRNVWKLYKNYNIHYRRTYPFLKKKTHKEKAQIMVKWGSTEA